MRGLRKRIEARRASEQVSAQMREAAEADISNVVQLPIRRAMGTEPPDGYWKELYLQEVKDHSVLKVKYTKVLEKLIEVVVMDKGT